MSRRVQYLEKQFAYPQLEPILYVNMGKLGTGTGTHVNFGSGPRGEFGVAGNEICVQMSFKNMENLEVVLFRRFQINIYIALGINDDRLAL
jgi:hypothetical protein